jgi:hypothetical protein
LRVTNAFLEDKLSKFIDRLKQLSERTPQPIGFRTGASATSRLKLQLIWALADIAPEIDSDTLQVADAVIISTANRVSPDNIAKSPAAGSGKPFGIKVSLKTTDDIDSLLEAGVDFAVFSAEMPFSSVPEKGIGKVLEIESTISDSLLRVVNAIPVDAVMVSSQIKEGPLSWQDLMAIQRLTMAINKPFLLPVPAGVTSRELQTLWEAGVDGVIIDITDKKPDELKELRGLIDKLETPDTNHRNRSTPTIPRMAPEAEKPNEDEEEDGEEDDE